MHRGHLVLIVACLLLGALAPAALAWYPRASQGELATATWCFNCANAYQGLEANKGWFDANEFNAIRYYDETGGLGVPFAQDRIYYYQTSNNYPNLFFDGTLGVAGGDPDYADGLYYKAIIERQLCEPSHFKIAVNAVDFTAPDGSIDLDLEVMEDVPDISSLVLRMVLVEDDVVYATETFQDVARAQVGADIPLTVQLQGTTQHVNQAFSIGAGWNEANLKIVAFVQDDNDRSILASASTAPLLGYTFRYYALGERAAVGPITANHSFQGFRLYNTGTEADNFVIEVQTSGPAGWLGVICQEYGCIGTYYETWLEPGQYEDFYVDVQAPTSGFGTFTVNMYEELRPEHPGRIKYSYLTDDLDVLIVDDDGARTYQGYFADALGDYGTSYGIWNHDAYGTPSPEVMAAFDAVVWAHGRAYPALDAGDRAALSIYLDNGGRLFITGQDLAWQMNRLGGSAYIWFQNYLHASYSMGDTGEYTLTGVAGDPISSDLDLIIQGGDGANDQTSPDAVLPLDAAATAIWKYDATRIGALRIDTGVYRAVYFAFGFEAIDDDAQRRWVLHRILNWLAGSADVAEEGASLRPSLSLGPNPLSASTTVRFSLPAAERVALRLFSADGRLLRTLAAGEMAAGSHALAWDRTGADGLTLPAGVYYCRLEGERTRLSRPVIVIR